MSAIDFIVVSIYFVAIIAMALTLVFKAVDCDDEEVCDNISIDFDEDLSIK